MTHATVTACNLTPEFTLCGQFLEWQGYHPEMKVMGPAQLPLSSGTGKPVTRIGDDLIVGFFDLVKYFQEKGLVQI